MALPGTGAAFDSKLKSFKKGGIKVGFQVLTSKKLKDLRRIYGKVYNMAVIEAMNEEMEKVLKKAKEDTPVDTGRLRDSGRLEKPRGSSNRHQFKWEIKFGGIRINPSVRDDKRGKRLVDYASIIHERGGQHGKPGFLINNWKAMLPGLTRRIDRKLRKRLPKVI